MGALGTSGKITSGHGFGLLEAFGTLTAMICDGSQCMEGSGLKSVHFLNIPHFFT